MAHTKIPDIGKYQIIELVGEGAMGVVYRAKDSVLGRAVAIKVMNESIARQDDLRERFLREAQAAASLQHPNVVCIYDMGDADGHLFIAMEYVDGVDLEKIMALPEQLPLQARLDIVIDVLTGLTFAHKRGIIHRDIKPANIRVTEDGRAKIMDFGVAHLASSNMTSTGAILGTPSYMAPEQITEAKTSPATDIFAVGGILYELLTRQKPFEGGTLQNLFYKIMTEKPRPVSEVVPQLPHALDRIVDKALAKDPGHRYSNALDMADDLSAVRAKLSGPSYPASVSLSVSISSAIAQAKQKQARSRNFAFAGAGAVVAVAILVGWSALIKPRAPVGAAAGATNAAAISPQASVTLPAASASLASPGAAGGSTAERTVATKETAADQRTTRPAVKPPVVAKKVGPTRAQTPPISTPVTTTQAPVQNLVTQPQVATPQPSLAIQRAIQAPIQAPPLDPTPSAPAPATAADIAPTIAAYARAIESKDIGAVRRVYPGLTSNQQRGFEQFFQAARSINVTFKLANVDGTPSGADARVVGTYEYVDSDGRAQQQPVSFAATLRREGGGWRLISVR
jgi:eukaryotic-like serine/threonine-protein kinase